jgi:hypothetical protein
MKAALNTIKTIKQLLRHPIVAWRIARAQHQADRRIAEIKARFPGCEGAMNVWPPVSGTATGYSTDGAAATTIRWGTQELLQTPRPTGSYAVVNRVSQKQKVEVIHLPQGSGIEAMRVFLKQGVQWTINVRDGLMTSDWPVVGETVVIVDMGGMIDTVGEVYTCTVLENDYEAQLKQPGERTLLVESLILIDNQTGAAQS